MDAKRKREEIRESSSPKIRTKPFNTLDFFCDTEVYLLTRISKKMGNLTEVENI